MILNENIIKKDQVLLPPPIQTHPHTHHTSMHPNEKKIILILHTDPHIKRNKKQTKKNKNNNNKKPKQNIHNHNHKRRKRERKKEVKRAVYSDTDRSSPRIGKPDESIPSSSFL